MSMINESFSEMQQSLDAVEEMVCMYALLENVGADRSSTWDRIVAALDEQGVEWRSYGSFTAEAFQRQWPEGY